MLEAKIQAEIVKFLLPFRKAGKLDFFSVPNEGAANPIRQGQLIAMGLRPGVSDLVLMFPEGRTVFVEVKNETGTQSPVQIAFEQKCHELGFEYVLVRSVDEVRRIIEDSISCSVSGQEA